MYLFLRGRCSLSSRVREKSYWTLYITVMRQSWMGGTTRCLGGFAFVGVLTYHLSCAKQPHGAWRGGRQAFGRRLSLRDPILLRYTCRFDLKKTHGSMLSSTSQALFSSFPTVSEKWPDVKETFSIEQLNNLKSWMQSIVWR